VQRLLATLGVQVWVWVLEFQQLTGDGWPHWHILIDRSALPAHGRITHFLDLKKAWATWRDKWHLGGLDFAPKRETQTAAHAVNYITKYLMGNQEGGFPEWVLLRAKRLRFVQACKLLGPLVDKPRTKNEELENEREPEAIDPDKKRRKDRTLIERMSACEDKSVVYAVMVDQTTGEQVFQYVGNIPARIGQLRFAAQSEEWAKGLIEEQDVYGRESLVLLQNVDRVREIIQENLASSIARRETFNEGRAQQILRSNQQKSARSCAKSQSFPSVLAQPTA
jgi:hypothetical protein